MPSAYRFTNQSVERITKEWMAAIERDYSHPCIITWVPFNESWGVPDLASRTCHQNCVYALYYLTKTLDATRPVLGNDGWENIATDIVGIHDYDNEPARLKDRYGANIVVSELMKQRSPAGRFIALSDFSHRDQPVMLTEFGGIAYTAQGEQDGKAWGYGRSFSRSEFSDRVRELFQAVHSSKIIRGFCYTQLTDTFQEANGLLFADRTPKLKIEDIAQMVRGEPHTKDEVSDYAKTEQRRENPIYL
jgi:hypothetical protein